MQKTALDILFDDLSICMYTIMRSKWRCILDHDGGSKVNCRTTNERPTFIDRAASIRGVTRMEFVLRSSEAAAALNERFVIALDAPVKPGPASEGTFRLQSVAGTISGAETIGDWHGHSRFD